MSDDAIIISKTELANRRKKAALAHSVNVAFNHGGSYFVVTLEGQAPVGVVDDPEKLSERQTKEIAARVNRDRDRLKRLPA